MQSLSDATAIVTGGGGGLGAAISGVLAREGVRVLVGDVRPDKAEAVAQGLRQQGHSAVAACLDVVDACSVEKVVAAARDLFGGIDILINNAGVDVTLPVHELTAGDWDLIHGVNLRGPFLMCREVVPEMRPRGSGYIVNIVSTAAKRSWPNASAYHASKWGLLGFSHALHAELRPHGIKVTAVVAGGMRTPFLLDRFPDIDVSSLQEPAAVAETVRFVLTQPPETVIPELMVLPMRETSWP